LTELGARLWQVDLPDSDQAMRVAARIIAAEVTQPVRAPRRRPRAWVIALAAGLLIALSFTPPGRAVTGELGRLVGIGDEPSIPRHGGNEVGAVVIGTAQAPSGAPIEIVAARSIARHGEDNVCLSLDVPEAGESVGPCLTPSSRRALERTGAAPAAVVTAPADFAPGTPLLLTGAVDGETAGVEVSYVDDLGDRQAIPTSFARLTPDLAGRIGTDETAGAYFAVLPADFLAGKLDADAARARLAGIRLRRTDDSGHSHMAAPVNAGANVRHLQIMVPGLISGGPVLHQPPAAPAHNGPPAALEDSLDKVPIEQVLTSHATLDHAKDRIPAIGPELLLGDGDAPDGTVYELAAFAGRPASPADRLGVGGAEIATCVSVDYPSIDEPAGFDGTCWGPDNEGVLHLGSSSKRKELGGKARYVVGGQTSDRVADVAVTYVNSFGHRKAAPGSYGLIDDTVAGEIGSRWTGGQFVAFLPAGADPLESRVTATAFDADGKVLATGGFGGS
jgi:hypothetical protein